MVRLFSPSSHSRLLCDELGGCERLLECVLGEHTTLLCESRALRAAMRVAEVEGGASAADAGIRAVVTSADPLVQRGGRWPTPRCIGTEDISSAVATVTLRHGCGARSQQTAGGREGHGQIQLCPATTTRHVVCSSQLLCALTSLPCVLSYAGGVRGRGARTTTLLPCARSAVSTRAEQQGAWTRDQRESHTGCRAVGPAWRQ